MQSNTINDRIHAILTAGDVQGLLALRRSQFGGLRMEGEGSPGSQGAPGGGGPGSQGSQGSQGTADTFAPVTTQEEFDRRVADRVVRERSKYSDYDDLKDKASKYDAEQAKNQSEFEKAQTAQAESDKKAEAATERANRMARQSAIVAAAAEHGAKHPNHIPALLATSDTITVDKDGNVAGVEEAVKKLATDFPDYFGKTTTTRTSPPAHGLGAREAGDPAPGSAGKAMAERRFPAKK